MLTNKMLTASAAETGSIIVSIGTPSTTTSDITLGNPAIASDGVVVAIRVTATPAPIEVIKFDFDGNLLWKRRLSFSSQMSNLSNVQVDSSDNVYISISGRNSGSINSVVLVKYNSSGVLQWQRKLTAADSIVQTELCLDNSGNPIIACTANVTVEVIKYNTSGTLQWRRRLTVASGNNTVNSAVSDASGNIFVGIQSGSSGSFRANIVKYNNSGVLQWQSQYYLGATGGPKIDIGSVGSIFSTQYITSGGQKGCIAKLDSSGTLVSSYTINGTQGGTNLKCAEGSVFVPILSEGTLIELDESLSITTQRRTYGTVGGTSTGAAYGANKVGTLVVYGGYASQTSTGNEGVFLLTNDYSAATGTYGWITHDNQSYSLTSATLTNTAGPFTDAAGSFTDAAGDITDAAGSLTLTVYPKD